MDSIKLLARFMKHVRVDKPTGCWLWTAMKFRNSGYGLFYWTRVKPIGAHRASFIFFNGAIPDGLSVLHRCDVKPCVNPAHLFAGTQADNVRDMSAKGRNVQSKKTHCPKGHAYAGENLRRSCGRRICRTCAMEHRRTPGYTKPIDRTECPQGHKYQGENVGLVIRGREVVGRYCRQCKRDKARSFWRSAHPEARLRVN